jgi:predicted outer membrane repeat protein
MISNTAREGGCMSSQAKLKVFDSSFSNNSAQSRGGVLLSDSASVVELYNSSLTENSCQGMCCAIIQAELHHTTV